MKPIHRTATAIGALCLALSPVAAHAYSTMYEFGDSLSDVGNVFIATGGLEPAAPYSGGRFSNGQIWVQDLSSDLGLGPVTPYLAGGNDYAFGGATTGYAGTLSSPSLVPTATQQVGLFLAALGGVAPSSALYTMWIGSNDVFNVISSGTTGATAVLDVKGAAQTEAGDITALASAGATDFLVPLVPDLGQTPSLTSVSPAASAAGTALALLYDVSLESDLASLAASPGIDLSFLNTFALLDGAIADPSAYGFTDVTDPCYVGPYTGGGTVCANPNQYLFWDQLHPTSAGQAVIASVAFDEVPEPGTLVVLVTGLGALAGFRRRFRGSKPAMAVPG